MACLYAIAQDCAEPASARRRTSTIEVDAYDEMNTVVPVEKIAAGSSKPGHGGIVCLAGVQSNQFPRAMAIARQFRAKGVPVAIGGFHVCGCISMLKELPAGVQEAIDLGITLFAGEAEEHFEQLLKDVHARQAEAALQLHARSAGPAGQTIPFLPRARGAALRRRAVLVRRRPRLPVPVLASAPSSTCRDASRAGATPTISSAIVRENAAQGITRFFITDDNFARNRNWEADLRPADRAARGAGLQPHFLIQVDTLAHKIPNFIEKAARAGCRYVFIGLESINPDNLVDTKKNQNRITEYRKMFQAWKEAGIVTYAGFIMGLPGDTPETIKRDIEIIQRELPVDILEFSC